MLGNWFAKDQTPTLSAKGLVLRAPLAADYDQWRKVRLDSRRFLKPFEPRWTEADLSRQVYRIRMKRARKASIHGTEFTFFVFSDGPAGNELLGGVTLSNIRRRVAQQVNLGYWMSVHHAGKGVMTHAVGAMLPFVFDELGLHRIHAACLPHNIASRRVLEKNQFHEEGYAQNYLQIDGMWCDHVLYALTRERYDAPDGEGR